MTAPATKPAPIPADALEALLAQFAELLADMLAPRLAAELADQAATPTPAAPTRRLLTLDELVELLPAGKSPTTWKRWIYERTRRGQIPGAHKIGGRLFFDPEHTIPWLTGGPVSGLDLAGEQSLDHPPVPADPNPDRPRRGP
jgi:hypothetical protein